MLTRTIRWLAILTLLLSSTSLRGQEVPDPVELQEAAGAGLTWLRAGSWGIVRLTVINPTDKPVRGIVTTSFAGETNLQYATEIEVPAKARRVIIQPIRAPDRPQSAKGEGKAIEVQSLLLDPTRVPEVQIGNEKGRRDSMLRLEEERPTTGAMTDGDQDDAEIDVMIAGRLAAGHSKRATYLRPDATPPLAGGLEALDQLVIASDHPDMDEAQLEALRLWVVQGGRLWLVMDEVDPEFARRLLRNDWNVTVVDRVALSEVKFDGDEDTPAIAFEQPVPLVRVLAPDMQVLQRVQGWPVALRKSVGQGELMITTLGAKAWVDEYGEAHEPLRQIASRFLVTADPAPLEPAVFERFLATQIGYSVVGRGVVLMLMAVFIGGLIVLGVTLARKNRLEYMLAGGAGLAVVIAILFLVIGLINGQSVPLTVASQQFVRVDPEQQVAVINGVFSVYSPTEGKGPIEATRGGLVWPDTEAQAGDLLRMVWTDIDKWQWRGLKLPSLAVRVTTVQHAVALPESSVVRLTFGPDGAAGVVEPGPFEDLTQVVLATPRGNMAPRLTQSEEGLSFVAGEGETLLPGQFSTAGVLDEQTKRRQEVYRKLMPVRPAEPQPDEPPPYPDRPTLLAWAKTMNIGIQLVQQSERRESALVALPIVVERPAPDTRVSVPATFVDYRAIRGPGGEPISTIYDNNNRRWIGSLSNGVTAAMQCELPAALGGLRLDSLKVRLNINAPGRSLEIYGYNAATEKVALATIENPANPSEISVPEDRASQLAVDGRGVFVIVLKVNDPAFVPGQDTPPWTISDLRVSVTGRTTATPPGTGGVASVAVER